MIRSGAAWRRELRRALLYHRRLVAAGLAAGAFAVGLTALSPPAPSTEAVVVAAADLPAGRPLTAEDVRAMELPTDAAPDGALRQPEVLVGRRLAAPARRGEILTDVRLVGAALVAGYGRDRIAVPVRVADADTVGFLQAGDVVDVVAVEAALQDAAATVGYARTVARAVPVIAIPRNDDAGLGGGALSDGGLLLVAATPETAAELARAAVTARLSITLRPA